MSRHSLPSSSLPDRRTSRHALAGTVGDDAPVADAPTAGRPASVPPVAIPQPRPPQESRHAADPAGRSGGHRTEETGRHAAAPHATALHATALQATATQATVEGISTRRAAEPVAPALPFVRTAPAQPPADATRTDVTPGDVALGDVDLGDVDLGDVALGGEAPTGGTPTRATRRHAAPTRHRRRADADVSRPGKGRRALAGLGGSRRTAAVLLTAAVALVALPTAGSAAVDQCRWQVAAHDLLVSLDGQTDARSVQLRKALTRAGVGTELPAECAGQAADQAGSPAPTTSAPRPTTPRTTTPKAAPAATPPTTTAAPRTTTAAPAPAPAAAGTGTGSTAAQALGWGTPTKSDDFSAGLGQWGIYDGSGHAGNGRRTPSAISTAGGIMTMTGDTNGNTGGMAWGDGQKYGRWEARVRSTAGSYHPVMLLWPSAENWPIGGEVDWMEISDPARKVADTFLHYGANNNQVQGNVNVDATQWHNWAVEWTPQGITTYLDGKAWWSTRNTSILPPGPMHMTIQLDNFGGRNTTTQMQVDWVRQYAL